MADYEGVTHAGIAVVAADTGRVLLAQRSFDETDDEAVQETFEFPGGSLEEGEDPFEGASREFREEIGLSLPPGEVIDGWRGGDNPETGHYQGFVYQIPRQLEYDGWTPTDEVQSIEWVDAEEATNLESNGMMRPEIVATMDWSLIFPEVSGNEDKMAEPEYTDEMFGLDGPIPVHGVIAPEEAPSGDKRAFGKGAMTRRPLRLPFSDQRVSIEGHGGSVVVGSVDRMMRKDGLIHWEGLLMESADTDDLVARMQFFGGKYGVSVDGDQGSLDMERTEETETLWYDTIRAAGLTAVAIPAFHEAHVSFGPHPDMPAEEETLTASMFDAGDLIGAQGDVAAFKRGPGWVTNPADTKRLHDYWVKPGEEGYAKIGWGTPGDFTRAKKLIGAKIAANSPAKMKYLNQIIAQWHFDALGYWPGDLDKPGNKTTAEARAEASLSAGLDKQDHDEIVDLMTKGLERDDIEALEDEESVWETVLVSSAGVSGNRPRPPLSYFHQHPSMVEDPFAAESGALVMEDPDKFGFIRTWGYAAEWGVCHVGMSGDCIEPPESGSDDYPGFHLGRTKVEGGNYVYTGVLTYGVGHRSAEKILSESANQAYFDNIKNAWASVRVGENERGIWFSGVVLPKVDADDLVLIEASGQVSGEWLRGAMRACLTVGVPGFPNERPTAAYDEQGNVLALAASAFGAVPDAPCSKVVPEDDPVGELALAVMDRIQAREMMLELKKANAMSQFAALRENWKVG